MAEHGWASQGWASWEAVAMVPRPTNPFQDAHGQPAKSVVSMAAASALGQGGGAGEDPKSPHSPRSRALQLSPGGPARHGGGAGRALLVGWWARPLMRGSVSPRAYTHTRTHMLPSQQNRRAWRSLEPCGLWFDIRWNFLILGELEHFEESEHFDDLHSALPKAEPLSNSWPRAQSPL